MCVWSNSIFDHSSRVQNLNDAVSNDGVDGLTSRRGGPNFCGWMELHARAWNHSGRRQISFDSNDPQICVAIIYAETP
jgi:hypothetical protein